MNVTEVLQHTQETLRRCELIEARLGKMEFPPVPGVSAEEDAHLTAVAMLYAALVNLAKRGISCSMIIQLVGFVYTIVEKVEVQHVVRHLRETVLQKMVEASGDDTKVH